MLHRLGTRPVTRLLLLSSIRGSSVRGSLRTAMAMPSPPDVLRVTTTEESSSAADRLCEALGFAAQVTREEIHSFYWWEGAVQSEPEVRISFETSEPFESVLRAVEAAHSYDVPMILADTSDKGAAHWKGDIRPLDGGAEAGAALAERLAASRLVACAQVAPDGSIAVKTVASARLAVARAAEEEGGGAVAWSPVTGNTAYLRWLEEECVAAPRFVVAADGHAAPSAQTAKHFLLSRPGGLLVASCLWRPVEATFRHVHDSAACPERRVHDGADERRRDERLRVGDTRGAHRGVGGLDARCRRRRRG
mmetsp:Transcript_14753/g.49649  ORF Transcript_14753/g.49649 Transcript_14753/m.49649 type:complete len:307 (-) Transcript_14753:928-1848(-)